MICAVFDVLEGSSESSEVCVCALSCVHSYGTNWQECSFSFSVSSQSIGTKFAFSLGSAAATKVGLGDWGVFTFLFLYHLYVQYNQFMI